MAGGLGAAGNPQEREGSMTTKPSAPRVAAHRARKAAAGLAEVRGIWAPKEDHARVKEAAGIVLNQFVWRIDPPK